MGTKADKRKSKYSFSNMFYLVILVGFLDEDDYDCYY